MGEERSQGKKQLLTAKELSERSRLSISTIYRLKKQGRLPFCQPGGKGGKLLFPEDAIEQAAELRTAQPCISYDSADPPPRPLSGPRPAWLRAPNIENEESPYAP